ncbi:C39 family peptidase [Mycobacterium sp. TY815]|uniref:C39 family peptidase n=1 Tax=Mycobacterium sp. TY815 TaxID=3050581 RepID=UPI002740F63A|nr:C39 family peptidase [Mycobacterium sp. TY815]MDP7703734.1 C39 family peptidase [Mycobacterium sp. TY815]
MKTKASKQLGLAGALLTLATASVIAFPAAAQANPGGARMYGDPAAAAPFWRRQHDNMACAEVAVADVVGQLTGNEPSEDEVKAVAANTPNSAGTGPIFNGNGTDPWDVAVLLGHYGIPSVRGQFTIGALAPELGAGRKVLAAVNGETLWNQPGDHAHEDHFVVVTGIDTGANVVHLNDSGVDYGRDEVVPFSVFEASWATSGHFAVIAK